MYSSEQSIRMGVWGTKSSVVQFHLLPDRGMEPLG